MSKEVYEKGLAIRREVLGAEHVDTSLKTADAFNKPLQDLVAARLAQESPQHAEPRHADRAQPAA
jgi:hypothetical protein